MSQSKTNNLKQLTDMKNIVIFPKDWIKLVIAELLALKANATNKEIEKLDAKELDGESYYDCYYGMLTDYAKSARALELKSLCTTHLVWEVEEREFKKLDLSEVSSFPSYAYTPLEAFCYQFNDYAKQLIPFLKGDSDETPNKSYFPKFLLQ